MIENIIIGICLAIIAILLFTPVISFVYLTSRHLNSIIFCQNGNATLILQKNQRISIMQ